MMSRSHPSCENDPTLSRAILEAYRAAYGDENADASLATVHYRGGREELEMGLEYCRSQDPKDRAVGADVLAQLGWSDRTFMDETVKALIGLLADEVANVVYCAAVGLGHRKDTRAVPHLVALADHDDPLVRYGVAFGLLGHDDPAAITCLIQLASDVDRHVRSWAVFGLGSQNAADTPELREALFRALDDTDFEVRGEALVGLACRNDPRSRDALLAEWQGDVISALSLEAAQELRDPALLPTLTKIHAQYGDEGDDDFKTKLKDAIMACTPLAQQD
jgi:HEAT repeat protein